MLENTKQNKSQNVGSEGVLLERIAKLEENVAVLRNEKMRLVKSIEQIGNGLVQHIRNETLDKFMFIKDSFGSYVETENGTFFCIDKNMLYKFIQQLKDGKYENKK